MLPENRRERYTAYAETLRVRFNKGFLKNMQEKPLWGLYKLEQDERGNIHKASYHPKGYRISIYKPRSWSSLDNVLEALASGKQKYLCHTCRKQSRDNPTPHAYSEERREEILRAYEERSSLRGLERTFGVSRNSVISWIKKSG